MADEVEPAGNGGHQWPLPPLPEDFVASPALAPRPRPERSFTTRVDATLLDEAIDPETPSETAGGPADTRKSVSYVPPDFSWSNPVAAARVVTPPASPSLSETQARLLAHCLLVPGLAEDVLAAIRKAWLADHALGKEEWDLLYLIEKQTQRYGNLILKQTDWPQRIQQAHVDKQYQDNPNQPPYFEGIVAIAWDFAFGPTALVGSLEEGQGHLREVMQWAIRKKLLEILRKTDFEWESYGEPINRYVSLLNELDVEGTDTAFRPDCETLTTFLRRPKDQPYLVEGILAAGQLAVIGGPEKGMKTNVTVDLALSLAAGVDFLGHFPVPRPAKVLLVTGETCEKPLENLCRRILAARGLSDVLDNLLIQQEVPSLASKVGLNRLVRLLSSTARVP
jgi:hypothetical protein